MMFYKLKPSQKQLLFELIINNELNPKDFKLNEDHFSLAYKRDQQYKLSYFSDSAGHNYLMYSPGLNQFEESESFNYWVEAFVIIENW